MAFRVMFTGDEEFPILFDDSIVPLAETIVIKKNKFEFEAIEGFWLDASTAIVDSDGIVNFS